MFVRPSSLLFGLLALLEATQSTSAGAIVTRSSDKHGDCGDLDGKIYFAPRADVIITIQAGKMKRCHGAKERYTIKRQHTDEVRWHTQNSVVNTDVSKHLGGQAPMDRAKRQCRFDGVLTNRHGTAVFDFLDSDDYLQPGYTGVSNGVRIVCGI